MPRPSSWRDVPINPVRGARYVPGGLGSWRSVVPVRGTSTRSRSGGRDGRGQPNELERQIAERAINKDGGIDIFNAGGRALLGILDALDTPRAVGASAMNQAISGILGDDEVSFQKFVEDARRNITFGEVTGLDDLAAQEGVDGKLGAAAAGFALDVALDPLTYVTGGAAKAGTAAGKPAARKLLSPQVIEQLGEDAVRAAERSGRTFTSAAERAKAVIDQGTTIAQREAQKALQYRSNQMLSPQAREAIGDIPGTYVKIPGSRRLKIDKLIEKVAPGRVVDAEKPGMRALRVTSRELPLGRAAAKARAKVTQSGVGNRVAQLFTKYPDLRTKILFGTPEEAYTSFMAMGSRTAGDLQRRLFETTWGTRMNGLLDRAKKAGVDGSDLRYSVAEIMDNGELGEASQRVMAQALRRGDDSLVDDMRAFFDDIHATANKIDPDLPWLQYRDNYTTRLPSDEAIAFRGGRGNAGGALKKDVFDNKRLYGPAEQGYEINSLFGVELKVPEAAGGRSVDQQIDDILAEKGYPSWFQKDAYKAFPEHVKRMASRYGDEFMAKQLRDLGIAEPSFIKALTDAGHKQNRINAAVYRTLVKAQIRADRAGLVARKARREADEGMKGVRRGRDFVKQAQKSQAETQAERDTLQSMANALDPEPLREFAVQLREEAETISVRRQALLDNIAEAEDTVFGLEHAVVEQSHKLNMETHAAYSRVTKLEAEVSRLQQELGDNYERMRLLAGGTDYKAAREAAQAQLDKAKARADKIIENEARYAPDAFDKAVADIERLEDILRTPQSLKVWADKQKNLGKFQSELMISADARKLMIETQAQIEDTMAKIRDIEVLLHDFEDIAQTPPRHILNLQKQIEAAELQLRQKAAELEQPMTNTRRAHITADMQALANVRASAMHELGVIQRAQKRLAEADEAAPQLLATLDVLHDTEAMGDKIIHAQFPDLPPEVSGARVREFFADRHTELQEQIDATNGQILSAYADRDTMRAELSGIRQDLRGAQRNLKKVTETVKPQERELWQAQEELLGRADEAMSRAIEIDDELEIARTQLGEFDDALRSGVMAEKMAEHYLSVMKARQLRYEAQATAAENVASEARKTEQAWAKIAQEQFSKPIEEAFQSALRDSYKQIGAVSMTQDAWMVEALRAQTIMHGPEGLRPALKLYDNAQTLWKAYALSTPGTVHRNLMGGIFNNYLSDIGVRSGDYGLAAKVVFNKGKLSPEDAAIFQQIRDAGILTGSATTLEIERKLGGTNLRPWSTDNKFVRAFRAAQEDVEGLVRGALAYRTLKNGGTIDDAIDNVMKFHFDYDDISAFERSVLRRIVPFYTWTRKNLPLMMEQIVKNPQKFTRFYQLKNEIELHSPEEALIPAYFTENMAIRMPFSLGGSQSYVLPDLPFTALNDVTDPTTSFSQVTPFIKTPVEYAFGRQFFKGIPLRDEYKPVPKALTYVPGLLQGLDAVGIAERSPDGGWMMRDKDLYVAEQMLPVFGRTRRLFPSEDKFQSRVLTSWISTLSGVGLRANTPQERRNAAFALVDDELERIETYDELGYFDEDTKMPRFGQTINAAYELLGVAEE